MELGRPTLCASLPANAFAGCRLCGGKLRTSVLPAATIGNSHSGAFFIPPLLLSKVSTPSTCLPNTSCVCVAHLSRSPAGGVELPAFKLFARTASALVGWAQPAAPLQCACSAHSMPECGWHSIWATLLRSSVLLPPLRPMRHCLPRPLLQAPFVGPVSLQPAAPLWQASRTFLTEFSDN